MLCFSLKISRANQTTWMNGLVWSISFEPCSMLKRNINLEREVTEDRINLHMHSDSFLEFYRNYSFSVSSLDFGNSLSSIPISLCK